jgi:hypothetical protein
LYERCRSRFRTLVMLMTFMLAHRAVRVFARLPICPRW